MGQEILEKTGVSQLLETLLHGNFDRVGIIDPENETDTNREYQSVLFHIKPALFARQILGGWLNQGFMPSYEGIHYLRRDGREPNRKEMNEYCDELYGEGNWKIVAVTGLRIDFNDRKLVKSNGYLPFVNQAGRNMTGRETSTPLG